MENKKITDKTLTGERAEYFKDGASYRNCIFREGESPLKHSRNITVENTRFEYKYPLWNTENVEVKNTVFLPLGKSGLWYVNNITIEDSEIQAPKEFRRSTGITLKNVKFTDAAETFWTCRNIHLEKVQAKGDYFAMNSCGFYASDFTLDGNYFLDGGKDIEIHNAVLNSKDAFWNCKNVTVYDSVIKGEYLGWYSKNLKFVNCQIESDQGLCYIQGLTLENCTLENTPLCFEYSSDINARINGKILSVKNPRSGKIQADKIETLILNPERCKPDATQIICNEIGKRYSRDPNPNE